jgi:hypothetical protein
VTEQPPVRWSAWVLTAGTLLSAACFVVGFVLSLARGQGPVADPQQLDLVLRAVVEMQPWGWSVLGVLLIIATPAAALLTTFGEMRRLQPRTAWLALVILAILGAAAVIAFSTG